MRFSYFVIALSVVVSFVAACIHRDSVRSRKVSHYPASDISINWDWSSRDQRTPGSDNWPITWGADGNQYTSWGDGGGFGGTNSKGRVSLGFARVEGEFDNYTGFNVWGGNNPKNPAQFGGKSYGVLSVNGTLYKWRSPGSNTASYSEARLATSTDNGATWTLADWSFNQSDDLILPTFLQFGQDYAGARDQYVYCYSPRLQDESALKIQSPGMIDLMRVPINSIGDQKLYEFFAGRDDDNEPIWTENLLLRQPVFKDPNGVGWTVSVTYNAGLGRYILMTEHEESFRGNLGMFEATKPWGDWKTITYESNWGGYGSTFFWNFSNKWTSENGLCTSLVFTGTGNNDSWNSIRGTFTVPAASDPLVDP